MLTKESVEKKLRKRLSNLKTTYTNIAYSNKVDHNTKFDGKSVIFQLSLDLDVDKFLDNLDLIYSQLLSDHILTYPILDNYRISDNDTLRCLKDYVSFLVDNSFYVFYKVSYLDNIKTKVKLDANCIEDTINNDKLNLDLVDLQILSVKPEKIIIELGVLYKYSKYKEYRVDTWIEDSLEDQNED